jgi:nitroreductase
MRGAEAMDLLQVIKDRRSTRAFLDKPVAREVLERLLSLATQAPSAINLQPWEFVIVSGEEKKRLSKVLVKRMRERNVSCGPGAKKQLSEYFVERQRRLLECILPNLPEGTRFDEFISEGSCNFYGGIVVGYLVLAAHAMGLGTCPIGLITAFDDDIREQLNIPDEKQVVIGIAVGYKDESSPLSRARSERVPTRDVVRWRD